MGPFGQLLYLFGKQNIMKPYIRGRISLLTKCIFLLFVFSVPSCTSTSVVRLEGNDFNENLVGQWDGNWSYMSGRSGPARIKIIKIDGKKVHLTGYSAGGPSSYTDEVSGRIENSTLILTWGAIGGYGKCKDELRMIRDDSNNLILDGPFKCPGFNGKVRLKKTE